MEQMSTEVQNLAHSIVAPYQQQIDQLQEKIQQQAELINQMEQKAKRRRSRSTRISLPSCSAIVRGAIGQGNRHLSAYSVTKM